MKKTYLATAVAALFVSSITTAIAADTLLDDVVVSVNKYEQKVFDTAASVSVINKNKIQDQQAQISLSETMAEVPGLYALNRQNYAQDVMISSRGFGSNSAFGARGLKIYVDGIPATIADGQGQTGHIDLASAEKIEVLRGPFTSIYGNSAGGVIHVFTENGQPGTQITPYASYGSYGTSKLGIKSGGDNGAINYLIDANHLGTNGSRGHSEAARDIGNAKIRFSLGTDSQVTLIGNHMFLTAQDPLGLLASDIASKSQAAGYNAEYWNSRKAVTQDQGGFEYLKKLEGGDSIKVIGYLGNRIQEQYQAAGKTTTLYDLNGSNGKSFMTAGFSSATNVLYKGGKIALDRDYYGVDAQLNKAAQIAGYASRLVFGVTYDKVKDRSTSECLKNISGNISTVDCSAGAGSINSDANYSAHSLDQYLKIETYLGDRLTLNAGARRANINLSADDNVSNFSSASKSYSSILPMASLSYLLNEGTVGYFSVGKGYDTPTLNQIKYSCTTKTTPNDCLGTPSYAPNMLEPSSTIQYEVGVKQKISGFAYWTAAIFQANTNKEIVAKANIAGRVVNTNADNTERKGLELFGVFDIYKNLKSTISYTYLVAQVSSDYQGSSLITAGKYLPGVPKQKIFADLSWRPNLMSDIGVEMISSSGLYANDTNTAKSNGYSVFNIRAGLRQKLNNWTFSEFARINNISNRYYVGSVIVNQKDNFYYEPSPGRNWVIGAKASYAF